MMTAFELGAWRKESIPAIRHICENRAPSNSGNPLGLLITRIFKLDYFIIIWVFFWIALWIYILLIRDYFIRRTMALHSSKANSKKKLPLPPVDGEDPNFVFLFENIVDVGKSPSLFPASSKVKTVIFSIVCIFCVFFLVGQEFLIGDVE